MLLTTRIVRDCPKRVASAIYWLNKKSPALSYSTNVGNSAIRTADENEGRPLRWKRVWALSMKRKKEIEGPDPPKPRSTLRCWNYKAELSAFQ